ncbi:MAG: bifunctional glutamate N-acetyltransferase/amino-acid acetyltransferase ArgJ [Lentisphaerales bacterium]|jgi:glutamate N-acetyltransferase/amino-acid N-acetyltransferase|nr:MAG: bifunctional glutamate N-acetyltransferase/amino-acid acetyltransferase ArgJ [Lentisphaerales bacterium]
MKNSATIDGGITAAKGFSAAGICAGIKKSGRPDMALVVSDSPAAVAAVFTTNKVQAAPVRLCRKHLSGRTGRAVIINSGNANACTGEQGATDALRMGELTAQLLGVEPSMVYVCSTGTIGVPMPMAKIEAGIHAAVAALAPDGGDRAAKSIMTTDTVDKQIALELTIDNKPVRIGGMAKGAGMIEPNMATMLSVLTTDAAVDGEALQACLANAVKQSFNCISVDGDQSTNDTVLFLANGAAGTDVLSATHPDWPAFCAAVDEVTRHLAISIVKDGEGATKFVTLTVSGAASEADARAVARAVANSLLVKTSWFGEDPNWGRIMDAVGYSGAEVNETLVDVAYDGILAVAKGQSAGMAEQELHSVLAKPQFRIDISLNLGSASHKLYTCDCSHEYVKINSEYTT